MNFTFLFKVRLHRLLFYLIKEREFMKKASIIVLQLFCLVVIPVTAAGATYTVTNTNDSGSESLRQAILDANANTGTDTIAFNINSGVQAIRPTSALPVITDPIIIDGSTQPGFSGTPLIVIDGTSITRFPPGLRISAGNSILRSIAINNFQSASSWNNCGKRDNQRARNSGKARHSASKSLSNRPKRRNQNSSNKFFWLLQICRCPVR